MLIDCLVYIALLALILGLAFSAFYRTMEHTTRLERNVSDIVRALRAGERWRDDVRSATGPVRMATNDAQVALRIPTATGEIVYGFRDGAVVRETRPGGQREEVLPRVKASEFHRDSRRHVTGWRWELELRGRQEVTRVRPLFTFLAVPRQVIEPGLTGPQRVSSRIESRSVPFHLTPSLSSKERTPQHVDALCALEPERGIYAASTLPVVWASKRHQCRAPNIRFMGRKKLRRRWAKRSPFKFRGAVVFSASTKSTINAAKRRRHELPLRWGEGWGEGERISPSSAQAAIKQDLTPAWVHRHGLPDLQGQRASSPLPSGPSHQEEGDTAQLEPPLDVVSSETKI
jgi:hypothetical protein